MKTSSAYFSSMKHRHLIAIFSVLVFFACTGKRDIPDVSGIKVNLTVKRFEKDLFAIDTNHIQSSLNKLGTQYGSFLNDYLFNILSLPPVPDSVDKQLRLFLQTYRNVYEPAEQRFTSFAGEEKEIKKALQFVAYYFPRYKLPELIITFIGPFEGYSNVLTGSGIAVGLQLYLGAGFPAYQTNYVRDVYPDYQSRRFEPAYIPVNTLTNIINDIYPPTNRNQPLIGQMVEEGKRMYVLDHVLPETSDTLKTGYTESQLKGCYDNEAAIWNFFIENNLLYTNDPVQIRDYTNDAPRTETLGPQSPGNIGLFVGWQIVKKWMDDKGKSVSLEQLLQTDAGQIFREAKYKPR